MDENRFWILASKKIAADISPDEQAELDLLYIQHPELHSLLSLLRSKPATDSILSAEEENKVLKTLRTKLADITKAPTAPHVEIAESLGTFQRPKQNRIALALLAGVAGVVCLLLYLNLNHESTPQKALAFENKVATRAGSKSQVKLPDGTLVILNADSKLSYPDNFVGNTREVTLEGEAFFEVTENKLRPFIIHSKMMDIKVLGTVFNVKAYPAESVSEASLIKGSIEVTLKERRNQKIMLKPSEKISIVHVPEGADNMPPNAAKEDVTRPIYSEPLISVAHLSIDRKENIIKEIGWTQNKLMFQNESLKSIAVTLQRWYGQTVSIRSEALKEKMFTGNFQEENLGQVLEALQASYNFNIRKENNSWVIY